MIKLKPTSWKIMLEILVKANPAKVVEVPIQFDERRAGKSKFNAKQMIAYLKHLALLFLYKRRRFAKFCMVGGSGTLMTLILTWTLTELVGLWYMLSLVITIAIVVLWNFNMNALWTFGQKRNPDSADYDWISFYRGNLVQKWWKRSIAKTVWNWIPASSSSLDIGCGSSPLISHYPYAIGIDINESKLAFMKGKLPEGFFAKMSGEDLDFEDKSFDYVLCIEVLEHLQEPEKTVSEIARVLKPEGKVVIATPDYSRKWWLLAERLTPAGEQHITRFTRKSLEETCQKYGLVPLKHKYIAGCDLTELFGKSCSKNGQYPDSSLQLMRTGVEVIKRVAKPSISRANFAVTYKCNQMCKSCNIWQVYRSNPEKAKSEITLEEFQKILESNNLMWLSITGGEPFLREDINEILKLCLKKLKVTSIITNGSKPELIEEAVRQALQNGSGLLTFNVSLEGEQKIHDNFVGREGSWEKAIETLERLSMIRCNRLRVGIEHLLSAQLPNQQEQIKCIEETAKRLGASTTYTIEQVAPFYANLDGKVEKAELPKVALRLSPLQLASYLFRAGANGKKKGCVAGEYSVFIDPYGVVYPCIFYASIHPLVNLRETEYRIGKLDCKELVKECKGCHTPCESYATMIFRPWRLL